MPVADGAGKGARLTAHTLLPAHGRMTAACSKHAARRRCPPAPRSPRAASSRCPPAPARPPESSRTRGAQTSRACARAGRTSGRAPHAAHVRIRAERARARRR
jgi:hypothetical protein